MCNLTVVERISRKRQKDRWKENRNKILRALAEKETMRFNQLVVHTGLSRRTVSMHLKRLKRDGIVEQGPIKDWEFLRDGIGGIDKILSGPKKYSLRTPQQSAFSHFANIGLDGLFEYDPLKRRADNPQDCFDRYGLIPFNPNEQRKRARDLTRKLVDKFLFVIMKLATYAEEGDILKGAMWTQKCLESIPRNTQILIEGYLNGSACLEDKDGRFVEVYFGDSYAIQGKAYIGDSDLVKQIRIPVPLNVFYKNPAILIEVNRRRKVRLRFLRDAIKKLANNENLNYLERYLEKQEKIARH